MTNAIFDYAQAAVADLVSGDTNRADQGLRKVTTMAVNIPVRNAVLVGLADQAAQGNLPTPEYADTILDYAASIANADLFFVGAIAASLAGSPKAGPAFEFLSEQVAEDPSLSLVVSVAQMAHTLGVVGDTLPDSGSVEYVADTIAQIEQAFPDEGLNEQALASLDEMAAQYADLVADFR
jgi:hypothetical protein